jgi:hypothetical protein
VFWWVRASGHSPGGRRQSGFVIMVVYATEILRALRPVLDASTATGIVTNHSDTAEVISIRLRSSN